MQPILDEPWKTDDWYLNQWRAFYRLRMQRLRKLYLTFAGIAASALVFGLIPEEFKNNHAYFTNAVMIAGGLAWCSLGLLWFSINWQMTSWDCPRCGEPFFARNPFRRRCRSCGLLRPRQSQVGSLASM